MNTGMPEITISMSDKNMIVSRQCYELDRERTKV